MDPAAKDAAGVRDNRAATKQALRSGAEGLPQIADVLSAAGQPTNPFYTAPPLGEP